MTGKHTEKRLADTRLRLGAGRALARLPAATSRYAPAATARFIPAKAVGSFVPGLTRKAFEKFGFSAATLLTDWAQIAGAELSHWTAPERLKWPRGVQDGESAEGRPGATLVLRVDPARALDVEYRARQIVERINAYFGYRAVAELRLVQAPLVAQPKGPAPPLRVPLRAEAESADPLTEALARLGRGVLAAAGKV